MKHQLNSFSIEMSSSSHTSTLRLLEMLLMQYHDKHVVSLNDCVSDDCSMEQCPEVKIVRTPTIWFASVYEIRRVITDCLIAFENHDRLIGLINIEVAANCIIEIPVGLFKDEDAVQSVTLEHYYCELLPKESVIVETPFSETFDLQVGYTTDLEELVVAIIHFCNSKTQEEWKFQFRRGYVA